MPHFEVIQPSLPLSDPAWGRSGVTISRHRTRKAAFDAVDAAAARLHRQLGAENSWYDWHVILVEDDGTWYPAAAPEE